MKLSELFNGKCDSFVYGVEVDSADFISPPEGLKEVGFMMRLDKDGMIDEALLDTMISYKLANVGVILEVPISLMKDSPTITVDYLVPLSSNIGISLSILPPKHPSNHTDVGNEFYNEMLIGFTKKILEKTNYENAIYPITNFFEYLFLEQIYGQDKLSAFTTTEPYMVENFLSKMSKDESNSFKDEIRKSLYDYYGGKEEFDMMAKSMIVKIYDKTKELISNNFKNSIQQKQIN